MSSAAPEKSPASRPPRRLLLALLALLPCACGYSSGHRLPEHIKTVGISFFGNDSPLEDLEREFHTELTRVVRDFVGVKIERPRRADLVVEGTITSYFGRGGVRDSENKLLETGLSIGAQGRLIERATQTELSRAVVGPVSVGYIVGTDQEEEAKRRILKNLADALVMDLFTPLDDR